MKYAALHLLFQFVADLVLVYGVTIAWNVASGGDLQFEVGAVLWVPVVRAMNGDYLLRFVLAHVCRPWEQGKRMALYVASVSIGSIMLVELFFYATAQVAHEPLFIFKQGLGWLLLTSFAASASLASLLIARSRERRGFLR